MIEMPQPAVLDQIAKVASEDDELITRNMVSRVLAAYGNVIGGPPIGTFMRDPKTKSIAVRAVVDGLHMWHISCSDGSQYSDYQPYLEGWEEI